MATGGDNSNINITGSDIEGEDIDLKADKDIILRAAREHNERQSSNRSSSASAGLSLSFSNEGVGASVVGNANQSKGKGIGTDHLLRPTNITAKKELNIRSGRDMSMEGAKAKGEKVTVDVARNLVISTPQERRDYESQQSSSGSAISIPIPGAGAGEAGASVSYGKEKIDSRFRSVDERSGIEAGDEGFAVAVQGKTKLTGAVIASTDQAVSEGRNRFNGITGKEEENNPPVEEKPAEKKEEQPADNAAEEKEPAAPDAPAREEREPATSEASRKEEQRHLNAAELELIDVVNQAEYRANAVAINAGVGSHLSSSGGGVGRASGAASSITRSGISGIAGDKGVRTGDKSSGITPIFDEEAVKKDIGAQVIITQEFSKQASRVIGDYAAGKLEEAAMLEEAAAKEPDPKKAKALQEKAKAIKDLWAEGGTLRVALHTLVGGLTGNVAGAAGAGISQAIIPTLGEKLAELDLPAPLEQALIQAVALGIGAAAGGNAGAAAAESATVHNYLSHKKEKEREDLTEKCDGGECSKDEKGRLDELNRLAEYAKEAVKAIDKRAEKERETLERLAREIREQELAAREKEAALRKATDSTLVAKLQNEQKELQKEIEEKYNDYNRINVYWDKDSPHLAALRATATGLESKEAIEEQAAPIQTFKEAAKRIVADYAAAKLKEAAKLEVEARKLEEEARKEADPEKAKALRMQANAKRIKARKYDALWGTDKPESTNSIASDAMSTIVNVLAHDLADALEAGASRDSISAILKKNLDRLELSEDLQRLVMRSAAHAMNLSSFPYTSKERQELIALNTACKDKASKACNQARKKELKALGKTRKAEHKTFLEELGVGAYPTALKESSLNPFNINGRRVNGKFILNMTADTGGGPSYWSFQISSRRGTMKDYFKDLAKQAKKDPNSVAKKILDTFRSFLGLEDMSDKDALAAIDKAARRGDSRFIKAGEHITSGEYSKDFIESQYQFLLGMNYDVALPRNGKLREDIDKRPIELQEMFFETSIRNGGKGTQRLIEKYLWENTLSEGFPADKSDIEIIQTFSAGRRTSERNSAKNKIDSFTRKQADRIKEIKKLGLKKTEEDKKIDAVKKDIAAKKAARKKLRDNVIGRIYTSEKTALNKIEKKEQADRIKKIKKLGLEKTEEDKQIKAVKEEIAARKAARKLLKEEEEKKNEETTP